MARGTKKKTSLTPEEKLAQALVPEAEQPYKVPENWRWVHLSRLVNLYNGDRGANYPSKKDYVETGIPFINAGSIQNGKLDCSGYNFITQDKYDALRAGKIQINDILYCLRGSLGKTAIVDFESPGAISSSLCILRVGSKIVVKYLYYLLNSDTIVKQQEVAENGSAQPNLSAASVLQYRVPLPPISEQQRIVDRIESLFAKLDEAKEKAQAVVDEFEDRKAAILHKAFTGELTAGWREQNNISSNSWEMLEFEKCINTMQNGIAKRKGNSGEPFVVLRLANLSDDGFVEDDLRQILLDEKEQTNYELHSDDVLMIRVNGSKDNVGKQYRITSQKGWAFCDHFIRIKYAERALPQYMVYFSKSETYRQYIKDNIVSSAGQNTISRKGMGKLQIPVPLIPEQKCIVSLLDNLLRKERQAKATAEQVIDQIDTMKKAILARAFRGGLGTNDPTEESAEGLLKQFLFKEVS